MLVTRCSMYGIFTYIYHKFKPNVGKYSIHGSYGLGYISMFSRYDMKISWDLLNVMNIEYIIDVFQYRYLRSSWFQTHSDDVCLSIDPFKDVLLSTCLGERCSVFQSRDCFCS